MSEPVARVAGGRAEDGPPTGGVARSAGLMVSGTVLGQLAVLASSPLLTRLYGPSEFGTLAVYAALLAGGTLVASLRYELAIPLPTDAIDAAAVLVLSFIALVVVTGLSAAAVLLAGDGIARVLETPALAPLLWLLPVGVALGGANKILTYWSLRARAFRVIAGTRMKQGIGMAVSQAGLGALGLGAAGLLVGQVIGVAAGLLNLFAAVTDDVRATWRAVRRADIRRVASRYRDFALFSTWSDVANVIGAQLPFVIFASRYSPTVAGLYLLAHRVANAPAQLVSESVGKVFMTAAVEARPTGGLPRVGLDVFVALLRLGTGPLFILAPFAPDLFSWAFGASWFEAGRYVQAIVPLMACIVVFVPLTSLFAVLERQRAELAFQLTLLAMRVAGLVIGATLGGPLVAIACYASGAAIVYAGFGAWLLVASGVKVGMLAAVATRELAASLALGLTSLALALALPADGTFTGTWRITLLAVALAGLLSVSGVRIVAKMRGLSARPA
jgi:O-antigen/teichoic acid export membrane protein